MGFFDRMGNLGKGVVGIWKGRDRPSVSSQEIIDAELDAVARKARVDAQLRKIREEKNRDAHESGAAEPIEAVEESDPGDHRPIKKTL